MTRRPARGRAMLLALAILFAACAPAPPTATARNELVIGIVGDPSSLLAEAPAARAVAALVVEPLVRRSATEDLEPRLVETVPTLENGGAVIVDDGEGPRLVATFRIRDGARWHDGVAIEAEDVRFAFDQDRDAAKGSSARSTAERIERIEVVDRRTIRVTYRAWERWDLYALAPRALPRHLLGDDDARARYATRPVHAGAYWILDRVPGRIELVPFPGHVIDRAAIDRIVVRTFADRTAVLSALGRREIDLAPYPTLDADLARTLDRSSDGSSLQVLYTPAQAIAMLRLGPSFSEPALRRTIALAIDRARIARSIFSGRVRAPATYLVPPLWAAAELGAPRPPDRDAARASLAGAGFRRGTFGVAERDGARLGGSILVPSGSPAMEDAARSVAIDLAALGIPVDVSEIDLAEIEDRVRRGAFELALLPEIADDPLAATLRYRGAVSDWFDVLGEAAREAPDRSEQRALYQELQRIWSDASPAVPLYQVLKVDVAPARLEGVRPAAHGAPITWNAGEWRLATAR